MAKTSGKTRAKAGGAGTRRATKRKTAAAAPAAHSHEDHIDACDFEFHESEATPDAELPAAKGGVETGGRKGAR